MVSAAASGSTRPPYASGVRSEESAHAFRGFRPALGRGFDHDEPLDQLRMSCCHEHRRVSAKGLADQGDPAAGDQLDDVVHVFVARAVRAQVRRLGGNTRLERVPLRAVPGEPVQEDRGQQRS
jgi:hypothetical protein